ncbi:MAG: carbon-nitrogen hydrolase family protein [Burkholderiales bacterium]|nr:carbon-nitrogen hydrolase family protein [Burkholderiales bacterium]
MPVAESTAAPFRIAALQMVAGPVVARNLAVAEELIGDAADQGARLVALPEWFCFIGASDRDKLALRERDGDGEIQAALARLAAKFRVWLIGGTLPLAATDPGKVRNSCLVFDDTGRRVARYDKIHLFGLDLETEKFRESNTIEPGTRPVAVDTPFGRIGLSVCYDVRFPELYRGFGPVDIISVPSAFTVPTGEAHWETLLRARAIENLAWVMAPAQGGRHESGRVTYGHSMIVDPWGKVVACLPAGPGVVLADIDPTYLKEVRAALPALEHRALN